MSRISFFQRFKQAENHATNNALLVLRYFYEHSPKKIEGVINSLLDIDSIVGLTFDQQVKSSNSVPDGLILQQPLRIFVETKRGGAIDVDQIRRHFASISGRGATPGDILVALTKETIALDKLEALKVEASGYNIRFAAVTFSDMLDSLREQCADYESDLKAIVEDYESCLIEAGLHHEDHKWLPVFPCGLSIEENVRYSLYYEPTSRRPKTTYRYIGIYNSKAVRYVGTISSICTLQFDGEKPQFIEEMGSLTEEFKERVLSITEETSYYNLREAPLRFYISEKLEPTLCQKTTPGGIQGLRYLDLSAMISAYDPRKVYTSAEIAAALNGSSWS